MRILHLAAYISGGAGRGAFVLHQQLLEAGIESVFYSAFEPLSPLTLGGSPSEALLNRFCSKLAKHLGQLHGADKTRTLFSITPSWLHANVDHIIDKVRPQILHFHWVCNGMISPRYARKLAEKLPAIWTLRDMYPLTGGCHAPGECMRWRSGCGACPLLRSDNSRDISYQQWQDKMKEFPASSITFVATSNRMHEAASNSLLAQRLHPRVIPVSIPQEAFRWRNRLHCREALGLSGDAKYVLFSALNFTSDGRKGWSFVNQLLDSLGARRGWQLMLVGDIDPELKKIPGVTSFGIVYDSLLLGMLYSAADVTIVPSEEEAFGKVLAESLASGTPVIAFSSVGATSHIEQWKTGAVCRPGNLEEVHDALNFFLTRTPQEAQLLSRHCAAYASDSFGDSVARDYIQLYQELIATNSRAVRRPGHG